MKKIFIISALVIVAVFSAPHIAQAGGCTMSISASELKAKGATLINFEQTGIETSAGYWSDYGVKFTADNGKAIYVNSYNRGGASTVSGEYSLFNDAIFPATSVNQPLKVTFKNGINQAGFYLGNGGAPTVPVNVSIKLYGKDGQQFCEVNADNVGKDVLTYVSFNTLLDVYSMSIDYGNTSVGEEIDDLMFVNSSQNIRYCQESDNGDNKYVFGRNTLFNQNGSVFLNTTDSCKDSNNVFEYVCNGSSWDLKTENCGSGYSCVNGTCQASVVNPVPYCTDSDNGKNSSVKGTVNLYSYYNTSYSTDICNDNNTVREYFCTIGDASLGTAAGYDSILMNCPYGCEDGACIAPPKVQATCSDTDNGLDSYTKGVTTGQKEGTRVYGSYTDSCGDKVGESGSYSGKWVVEQHCSGPADNPYVHTQWNECPYGCENGACKRAVEAVTQNKCVDSDNGYSIYQKGTLTISPVNASIYTVQEYCSDANRNNVDKGDYLEELVCLGNNSDYAYEHRQVKCPYGCENGACLKAAITPIVSANTAKLRLFEADWANVGYPLQFSDKDKGVLGALALRNILSNNSLTVELTGKGYNDTDLNLKLGENIKLTTTNGATDYSVKVDHISYNQNGKGYADFSISSPNSAIKNRLFESFMNKMGYQLQFYNGNSAVAAFGVKDVKDKNNLVMEMSGRDYNDKDLNFSLGDTIKLVTRDNSATYLITIDDIAYDPNGNSAVDISIKSQSGNGVISSACYNLSGNGFLAKTYNNPGVYYVDENIKHAFVTSQIYHSWFTDYSGVKSFPANEAGYINNLTSGSNICLNTSGSTVGDNSDIDTSDDEVNDCQDQTVYDGHFELCAGETLTHQVSNIKLTNVRNNKSYIYLKLGNSTKSTLVVYLGKSKDIYSKDGKKRVRITYEANSGDAVGKIKIQTMQGYDSMFCGNSQYNEGDFTTCLGSTITNYPTQIKFTVKDFTEDYVLLSVSGSNVSSVKIKKGQNAVLKAKDNTYLQVGYDGWAYGPQVNLSVKVLGMSCGNSQGNDGLYSACMSDTITHGSSGISAKINNFTDKFVVFVFSGASNYGNDTGVRLNKGGELLVQNANGTKLRYTYQSMTVKNGVFIKIETVQ